jgi:hypothetical protein
MFSLNFRFAVSRVHGPVYGRVRLNWALGSYEGLGLCAS